jgi:Na+/melibiose symporter-like transporter
MTSLQTHRDPGRLYRRLLLPLVLSWLAALLCIASSLFLFWLEFSVGGFDLMLKLIAFPTGLMTLAVLAIYKARKRLLENRWVVTAALLCLALALYVWWRIDDGNWFIVIMLFVIPAGSPALAGLAAYQTSKRVLEIGGWPRPSGASLRLCFR